MALPFWLADSNRLITNVVPVSLGLVLGLVMILTGDRISSYFTAGHNRVQTQTLSSRIRAALRHGLQTARINGQLHMTARMHAIAARQRQAGEWAGRLQRFSESARRPLTGALWLGVAGGLLGSFVTAT